MYERITDGNGQTLASIPYHVMESNGRNFHRVIASGPVELEREGENVLVRVHDSARMPFKISGIIREGERIYDGLTRIFQYVAELKSHEKTTVSKVGRDNRELIRTIEGVLENSGYL